MKSALIITAAIILGACATATGPESGPTAESSPISLASADPSAPQGLQPLVNASLPSSECGMVLWTLEGTRPAAVFQFITGKAARVKIAGRELNLTLTEFSGASGYGVFERQRFAGEEGLVVEVTAQFGLEFAGGAYLEQGLIRVRDGAGWSMVSPTAGIAGCRN
ncbi:MAG: hypothetical protein AAFW68_06185 [Pseudomonadota bacterium]